MSRISTTEYQAYRKRVNQQYDNPKPSKYRNVKTTVDGITFDSKAEARYYQSLKQQQKDGQIRWFNRQPSFLITKTIRYLPDFIVCDADGTIYVVDVKGKETDTFKVKAALFREKYPDLELRIER